VYFGLDKDDLEQIESQYEYNVVRLSTDLEVGRTYFWKVDTEHGAGDVWEFTVGPDFVFDPSNSCEDLTTVVSEIDQVRIALNQENNRWRNWCGSTRVREVFDESSFLQNYDLSECTDAKCGRDRMLSPVCDLEFVAKTVMSRSAWLGHIAADLNQPHCFGESCGMEDFISADITFDMPSAPLTWETCNFPTLYADVTKLFSIVSLKSAWSKDVACNHADVEQVYRSTILLSEATCSEEDVQEVSELILNEWFGNLVGDIRDCFNDGN
jgi:hypothetical protein